MSLSLALLLSAAGSAELPLQRLRLPEGFRIELYAGDVPNARALALGPKGTVFVGSRNAGKVYALVDADGDHRAERVLTLASKLAQPVGVSLHEGDLYVSAISRILRFDAIEDHLDDPPEPVVVTDALPSDPSHGWRFIAFGPDGKLYVPIGAPCNVCDRDVDGYASIGRMNPDGSGWEIIARGVRNTVGFDWHPKTGQLWFTDNGRDWLGDDSPACELNRLDQPGQHFGFPYCHAGEVTDPEFGSGKPCSQFVPPVQKLGAHVAPLGMTFLNTEAFPVEYRDDVYIAEHGSWNRSEKAGYRITRVELEGDRAVAYTPFIEGWLNDGEVWGRPVDVLEMPDGALLISDDHAGAVYRVSYRTPRKPAGRAENATAYASP